MPDFSAFFGYPSRPPGLRQTLASGAEKINDTGLVIAQTWEDLRVAGAVVIDRITRAINDATVACFDVTTLNQNVMFELGFSVGSGSRIWLLFDESDAEAAETWKKMRLLTTIGYAPYVNSDDIRANFLKDSPHLTESTLFETIIAPGLSPGEPRSVFYLPSNHPTDASRDLGRYLSRRDLQARGVTEADPRESSVYPLSWYAQQIYRHEVTIAHLTASRRLDAPLHNARTALIAGIAHGMAKPVLLLTEEDSLAPIDYRELARHYDSPAECIGYVREWLRETVTAQPTSAPTPTPEALNLFTELKSIHLGEAVAEHEADDLHRYFIETASFQQLLTQQTTVFVGRKGSGKTANFIRAAQRLDRDPRNIVCVIKPYSSELRDVVAILQRVTSAEAQYLVEALWSYLLYTEIARSVATHIRSRPAAPPTDSSEWKLLEYVDDPSNGLTEDFGTRLEQMTRGLAEQLADADNAQALMTEELHGGVLKELRQLLARAVSGDRSVVVLIDNLDKAWDRSADLRYLSRFILGLLSAVGRVEVGLAKEGLRFSQDIALAVFLRADIFDHVLQEAREPDKIPTARLRWDDPALLLRVIEERYHSGRAESENPEELWEKFFVQEVRGWSIRDYIAFRVLPRPRDIVHLCRFALNAAINAKRNVVGQSDIEEAEQLYSQFALEALLVGNGLTIPELESVLYEFAGGSAYLTEEAIDAGLERSELPESKYEAAKKRLREIAFLGTEVKPGIFDYAETDREFKRIDALANALRRSGSEPRFSIHPAFRPYLEVEDPELPGAK